MREKKKKNNAAEILRLTEKHLPGMKLPLYASYDDGFSSEELSRIIEEEDPELEFEDMIMQQWDEAADYYIEETAKEVIAETGGDPQEVMDLIRENTEIEFPFDHYRKQEFNVPIMLDTGDGNWDFTFNDITAGMEPDERSSIVWLVKQQGHTVDELKKAISMPEECSHDKVTFMSSVQQEIENCPSSMSTLTFLVKMPAEDIIKINREMKGDDPQGSIRLSSKTMCGLFSPWTGGGSTLEIKLEKEVKIPIAQIWSCAPDVPKNRGNWWYGVDETYGLTGRAWTCGGVPELHI